MENFRTKIFKNNNKILKNLNLNQQEKTCNCRKEKCPLNNDCLANYIIYRATIKTNKKIIIYVGSTSTTTKNKYNNHKPSVNNKLRNTIPSYQFK